MENKELLNEIASMLNEQRRETASMLNEQRRETASMLKDQRQSIISEVSATIREQNQVIFEYVKEVKEELRSEIFLKIENDIEKRLDTLTDGYKLNHEKQWELERKMEAMEIRLAALEERIA